MRVKLMPVALIVCSMTAANGYAQQAPASPAATQSATPARDAPRPEELEPAVDTTHAPAPAGPAPVAAGAAPQTSPSGGAASSNTAAEPRARAAKAPAGATTTGAAPGAPLSKGGAPKGPDRLQLDTTDITGNRELPKVLYIVPWKRSDLGDLAGRPVNSLLDEVLQPLDRDVFKRENRYYDALKPDRPASKADLSAGSGDKP